MEINLHLNKKYTSQPFFFRYWDKTKALSEYTEENIATSLFVDEASFEFFFRNHYSIVYKIIYQILRSKDNAEDVTQDVFVKLWNKRDTLYITGSHKAYLCRTAMNAAYDHLRKYKKEAQNIDASLMPEIGDNHTETSLAGKEVQDQITTALNKLPDACKNVFLLSREQELSYKEIAETLNISVKTVENHIGKALKILREELKPLLKDLTKTFILSYIFF